MTFWCYPACSTCKKAQKWLDDRGIPYTLVNIKEQNPDKQRLAAILQKSGAPAKKLFNTSGLAYRALALKDKLPAMTQEEMLDLLCTDGMLVKRPILEGETFALVGFREARWADALLNK